MEKRKENIGFALEPIETQRKHRCCVGTYGKHIENTCVASEPIENARTGGAWEPLGNRKKTQVLRWNQ